MGKKSECCVTRVSEGAFQIKLHLYPQYQGTVVPTESAVNN